MAVAALLILCLAPRPAAAQLQEVPSSGEPVAPQFQQLDEGLQSFVHRWAIPGAAVAIYKDGEQLFARGYGYADLETHQPVNVQSSLFRIASLSKPITAAAVLKLQEHGRLNINDRALPLLNISGSPTDTQLSKISTADPRLSEMTIKDLLNMTAGWDTQRSGDPVLQPYIRLAARRFHTGTAADFDTTMRYVFGKRLDFTPGSRFSYSNFTYGLLGKIIEHQSADSYFNFVRKELFDPCGVKLYPGHTLAQDRLPDEVTYYASLEPSARPFLPCSQRLVSAPYARAYLEVDLPILGWLASAPQLAKLFDAMFSSDRILSGASRQQIMQRPDISSFHHGRRYFSMGWEVVQNEKGRVTLYKDGTLPGTRAFAEHTAGGVTWVALFNARPPQQKPDKFARQLHELMSDGLTALSRTDP